MFDITLEDYKDCLVNLYLCEYDNNDVQKKKRKENLAKYDDDFLISILLGTNNFVQKILKLSDKDYDGFIKIPLEQEPKKIYIDLGLVGGWMSDTIIQDTDNNLYSIRLVRQIFGSNFIIEPCMIDIIETWEEDDEFAIMSEDYLYYLYIQCKKEVLDNVRGQCFKYDTKVRKLISTK